MGVDDPEASGYTLTIAPTQIVDWSTGAPVVVNPNATKYIISIKIQKVSLLLIWKP